MIFTPILPSRRRFNCHQTTEDEVEILAVTRQEMKMKDVRHKTYIKVIRWFNCQILLKRKALLDDVIRALLQHHMKTILLSETANVSANKHSTSTFCGSFSFKNPTCRREHGFSSKYILLLMVCHTWGILH